MIAVKFAKTARVDVPTGHGIALLEKAATDEVLSAEERDEVTRLVMHGPYRRAGWEWSPWNMKQVSKYLVCLHDNWSAFWATDADTLQRVVESEYDTDEPIEIAPANAPRYLWVAALSLTVDPDASPSILHAHDYPELMAAIVGWAGCGSEDERRPIFRAMSDAIDEALKDPTHTSYGICDAMEATYEICRVAIW